jgi:hypothetical protein
MFLTVATMPPCGDTMIIVREVFTAKPGNASKLAKMFRKVMPEARVMTDLIGRYNTVVMEWEAESLSAFEQKMEEYKSGKMSKDQAEEMKHYTEMYLTGKREIYQVVE